MSWGFNHNDVLLINNTGRIVVTEIDCNNT